MIGLSTTASSLRSQARETDAGRWTREMKTHLIIGAFLCAVVPVLADDPAYLQNENGLVHGPYQFTTGETVRVGSETATVVQPSPRKIAFQKKLEETVLPSVTFQQVDVTSAVQSLQRMSGQNVPTHLPQEEVRITLDLTEYAMPPDDPFAPEPESTQPPLITFNTRYVSLLEAIKIVAAVAALDFRFDEESVALFPKHRRSVQPAESAVPSKAAPSASSDVR